MPHPLGSILNPQSVAVVGASREPGKIGYNVVKRLMDGGFAGDVYPINPNTTEMFGLPCYPSVVAVPGPIDLAVLTVTDRLVASVVEDCIGKGVKGVIIITAGFAETGPEGKTKEQTLVDRARASGIRIMGPNCMGLYNAALKLNVTGVSPIPSGSLAFVSQSGGMGQELFHAASRIGAGFSYFISLGNEADIRFHEYLEYLEGDDSTRAILLYMEGLRDGRHFLEVAARVTRVKPIVAIKGGATPAGSRSSLSHTGALAGADAIFDAAFRQVGVIRVEEPEELIEVAHSLAILPIPKGPRVGILCDGGGYATILADAAERHHLSVPVLSPPVQERLVPLMPHRASPRNPVEFAGAADDDPMAFARCAEVCLRSTEVDGLLLAGTFGGYASIFSERLAPIEMQTSRSLGGLLREHRKPIIMQTFFARDPIPALQILRDEGVPVVASLERAARCLDALVRRASISLRPAWTATPPPVSSTGSRDKPELRHDGLFLESEAYEILGRYGVRHPAYQVIHNETEVEPAMSALGVPVVMKVLSTNVPHKTDVGGIAMDVSAPDHARRTFAALMTVARNTGEPEPAVLVVQQVSRGIEMIIGVAQDASVGPVVMIGLGGIFVEIVKDVAFRVMPIARGDAEEMLRELRAFRVLHGYRGYPPTDVNAIVELLLQVSNLVRDFPHVQQLDLNPVIVQPHGVTVVDVKLKL